MTKIYDTLISQRLNTTNDTILNIIVQNVTQSNLNTKKGRKVHFFLK